MQKSKIQKSIEILSGFYFSLHPTTMLKRLSRGDLLHLLFLLLIPVFYFLGQFRAAAGILIPSTLFYPVLFYEVLIIVFVLGSKRFFGELNRAILFTAFLLVFNFYWGYFYDYMERPSPAPVIFSQFRFLLPVSFLFIYLVFFLFKKWGKLSVINCRIGTLFLLGGIIIHLLTFPGKPSTKATFATIPFKACDSCKNPDIYFIVADGYAGQKEMKELFKTNNDHFYKELHQRSFWTDSSCSSNYYYTNFSMASVLQMEYMPLSQDYYQDIAYSSIVALNGNLTAFLKKQGYKFRNLSIFQPSIDPDLNIISATSRDDFQVLTNRTLVSHLSLLTERIYTGRKDFFDITSSQVKMLEKSNEYVYSETIKESKKTAEQPRFIYSHILAPHAPYLRDSLGQKTNAQIWRSENRGNKSDYISYLKYLNKQLINLIDSIETNSHEKPIILLISDHGFREFEYNLSEIQLICSALLAVKVPSGQYPAFHQKMSHVNLFRTLLNQEFDQHLPYLKDSMVVYQLKGLRMKID